MALATKMPPEYMSDIARLHFAADFPIVSQFGHSTMPTAEPVQVYNTNVTLPFNDTS